MAAKTLERDLPVLIALFFINRNKKKRRNFLLRR